MPGAEQDTAARVSLGKKLFMDPRLSINSTQSCSSCHRLEPGFAGADNLPLSPGARGDLGNRNTPTVLNSGWQFVQFWDGRAADLVEQAKGPILNPVEMAMPDETAVEERLNSIQEYSSLFTEAFPDAKPAISFQNAVEAIAAFERTLMSPSRFDDFLDGNPDALTDEEKRGLKTFLRTNCQSCHDGALLGGGLFEPLGKENAYENQSDPGRYEVTGLEKDRMLFKVAPLRNIALTSPYFHDGRIATLQEAVQKMAYLQLNKELTEQQIEEITAFLSTLTGKVFEDN
jgi:cytochrome c peroxidase